MAPPSGEPTLRNGIVERSFADLLDFHLKRGTRPKGDPTELGTEWTNRKFADALQTSERNVRNWRNGRNTPPPETCAEISQALFGNNPLYTDWRTELREAPPRPHREGPKSDSTETRRPRNLPFASLGSRFKGREPFLERLHAALSAADGQGAAVAGRALHGLGGIGKTRLAVEYALRHETEYTALLFVRAETPMQLNAGLAALAGPDILDLPEKKARLDEVKIRAALGWLEHHPGWLMILDNVDDADAAEAVAALLARLRGGKVVVTGRMANFPASIRKLELGVLTVDDAAAFLLERTDGDRIETTDDQKFACDLAEELGGLALGLEQAGAYIATERISFSRYLTLWNESHETVVNWFDRNLMTYDHDTGLAATWLTSVKHLNVHSRRLLEQLAYFSPEPIPDSLLDVPSADESSGFAARTAISDLYAYSLVSRVSVEDGQGSSPGFSVHRLVQDFTCRNAAVNGKDLVLHEALAWVAAGLNGDPGDVRSWPHLDPLVPHVLALANHGDKANIAEPTTALYTGLGIFLSAKARFIEAERVSRRALAIAEASYGQNHPNVATSFNNLAVLLCDTNRLVEAEPLLLRALAIDTASYGTDHPTFAIHLNNLAELLRDTNRLVEAERLFRRVMAIFETSYGLNHPNVARSLNNLAELLRDTNRLADAEPLLRRALAINKASYGPDHPNVAFSLNNLAALLRDTNRRPKAKRLFRRALTIVEGSYGPDHPNVARGLNNLAGLLYNTNGRAEAERLLRRALAIDEASYGPDHPNVATDLNNLAVLLRDTNRPAEAEQFYRRALAIDEVSYGPHHPKVAIRLNNLGRLLHDTDRLDEAEQLFRRTLAINTKVQKP